ncbi:MAG TPA: cobyric acid synthase [Methanomicrobiales archaeon]|jgi:adenosylcobyric acid synthase|nr:cobyric acid synthase [Methanomicrobiales archaeon]
MSLMVLGTSSHAGKSIAVTALCRMLHRRGIGVAPFKSQNMSLNSFVTRDGSEIGIAQAVQSFAAGLEPEAEMNPVLLKPKGEGVSQVVLLGKPYRDLQIRDYYRETEFLLGEALVAYRKLEEKYGQVVVEGAGGAAEMNLYDRDIANVLLARALKIPIILIGDIERGGIFAQMYGTIQLLPDDIRPLVKGIIVNKFRGDPALFYSGVRILREITGIPVLGVVPYADIPLPSEDSLSLGDKRAAEGPVRIAVIRLPHISNFTDFEPLERLVPVDYVDPGRSLSPYDCIIIPGTKNTVEDLAVLQDSGAAAEIRNARERGVPVIGICGGFQMLGKEIHDLGIEGGGHGVYPGLGLLSVITRFARYEKTTRQVHLFANPVGPILSGMDEVTGYEIHMGETERSEGEEAFSGDGAVSPDGLIFGTYLHGLFQNESAVNALLSFLYGRKGIPFGEHGIASGTTLPVQKGDTGVQGGMNAPGPDPYDQLADLFEAHLDMEKILAFFVPGSVS